MMKNYWICTPGPAQLAPSIYKALQRPIMPHYGREWVEKVYQPVCNALQDVFQTKNQVFIIPSSGSGGVESAFCSLANNNTKVLILSNGYFGQRMAIIAKKYFSQVIEYKIDWGQVITSYHVEKALKQYPEVAIVGIVHGETSTGISNDIRKISSIVKKKDRVLVVDAVATLAGQELYTDEWNIDICISASQKAIGAPPGMAFIAVSDFAFSRMRDKSNGSGFYFNLLEWRDAILEWGDTHPYPVTLPVNLFYALYTALEDIRNEGLNNRISRHKRIAKYTQDKLFNLGLDLFNDNQQCSSMSIVTAVKMPEGLMASELLLFFKKTYQIIIAKGQADYRERIFRIGHLGYNAREDVIDMIIAGIEEYFKKV